MTLSSSLFIFAVLHTLLSHLTAEASSVGRRRAVEEVLVVEGEEALIPCAITTTPPPPSSSSTNSRFGTVQLVLWYKQGDRSSIYSYDRRDSRNPKHWSNSKGHGSHLSFNFSPTPPPQDRPHIAFLKLSHAHSTDAGVYSCRVDYYRARTSETRTRLTVVVPPSQPSIEVWEGGRWRTPTREMSTTQVEIGAHLTLRCTVMGGQPLPEVTWWRGGEQLLGSVEEMGGVVRSVVKVVVGPTDAHTPLVCQAANTPLVTPLRTPLHLLVLLSPTWVRIVGGGKPMSAGVTYMVECRSKGARPPPVLTWSVGGKTQVHASSLTDSEGETVSRLRYTPEAAHAGSLLTCTARPPDHTALNTPTSWIKSDSVLLNVMYKPEVELNFARQETPQGNTKKQRRPEPFSPSTSYKQDREENDGSEITKEKEDKDPAASRNRDGGRGVEESGGGKTKGVTESFVRGEEDQEAEEEDGERRNMYSLSEGEGGVLQCHVTARPPAFRVTWHRNDLPLSPGSLGSGGVVMGNQSIVLQKATREDAGDYTCTAHNAEGSSRSNPVRLEINHGPICRRSTPLVLGVPRHHPLNVTCQVSSYPPPSGFTWELRTYVGRLQVSQERVKWRGTTSWIIYTPRATEDYGELMCWAHTREGRRQEVPCVARLVAADTPDAPERCGVSRRTPSSLTVSCIAAHDGGLPQTFHVWVSYQGQHVNNASSASSKVTVRGLQPNTAYSLTLWSANTYGTSTLIKLQASTTPTNITVSTSSSMNGNAIEETRKDGPLSSLAPSVVAVVAVVTVVGVVVGVVAGMLSRHITLPIRHSADHDAEDDYQAAAPPSPGRRLKVHLRRSGELCREGEWHPGGAPS